MAGIIIGAVVVAAVIAALVILLARRRGGLAAHSRGLKRLADLRGWHYSRPDGKSETYGLSGESMLRGADESSLDWRVRWHLRTTKTADKDKTELKCADVPLQQGWVFLDPRSHAGEIKARQRAGAVGVGHMDGVDAGRARHVAWKEAQVQAHEMPVGSPDFLAHYLVTATVKEAAVRRLLPQRMQKALLGLPHAGHIAIRMGAEGVVITCPALFSPDQVEQLIKVGDILVSSVAQEQTANVAA
jgi:hypothetical protein